MTRIPHYKEDIPGPNVIGVDLAKGQDGSAVVVMTGRGYVLHSDRWNKIDWSVTKTRLIALGEEWNAALVVDQASMGGPIVEDLTKSGRVVVHGVNMNSADVKSDLITSLQMSFDLQNIWIGRPQAAHSPPMNKQLFQELMWYETKLTAGGRLSYSAPKGLTDDLVIALALANWGRLRGMAGTRKLAVAMFSREEIEQEKRAQRGDRFDMPGSRAKIGGMEGAFRTVGGGQSRRRRYRSSWM